MEIQEAKHFFENIDKIYRVLAALDQVGLGYLKLGQSAPTLSGGECQRLKLATELAIRDSGKTMFVLDEPTTGLHLSDVKRLIEVLQSLVDRGNTVLVIEHHLDLLKCCDWLIWDRKEVLQEDRFSSPVHLANLRKYLTTQQADGSRTDLSPYARERWVQRRANSLHSS